MRHTAERCDEKWGVAVADYGDKADSLLKHGAPRAPRPLKRPEETRDIHECHSVKRYEYVLRYVVACRLHLCERA